MNTNTHIFAGIFSDEYGQRFIRIMANATDNAFKSLHENCSNTSQLQSYLMKVTNWDKNVIDSEIEHIANDYGDYVSVFKHIFINYVKSMRGNPQVKIFINLPIFDNFVYEYYIRISKDKHMRNGAYFTFGPLDQRLVCMECIRDALYTFLSSKYVKIEEKKQMSFVPPPPVYEEKCYASDDDSIVPEDSVSNIGYAERRNQLSKN